MRARRSGSNLFKKERPEKAEVIDILVENHSMSQKDANKVARHVTLERLREVEGMNLQELKDLLAGCTLEIKKATDETEANSAFKEAKETLKTLNGALKETTAPYKGTITLLSTLLEEKKED